MLNKKGQRELAYVVAIDKIIPIEGANSVEQAVVGGWHIMVKKDQFKVGDLAVYFEIDSQVPKTEAFEFLESKRYKIKTQKYFKGTIISQGLLMTFEDLGLDRKKYKLGDFLTKELGVTYADAADNIRKANNNKYINMYNRNKDKINNSRLLSWLYSGGLGKRILFFFMGKKRDKKGTFWPQWVKKTDEERCLLGQTKIWTDHGKIKISKIVDKKLPVKVLSVNKDNELEYANIISYQKYENGEPMIKITYFCQMGSYKTKQLYCTPDHKIFTQRGYIEARCLEISDWVYVPTTYEEIIAPQPILKIEKGRTSSFVYDIEVENNHNFIANGIVVHNCQNLPFLFPGDDKRWIVTEKIDGTSTTFTLRKNKFYVCSRNVCFDTPKKEDKLFYETNVYAEMAEKYNIKDVLTKILKKDKKLEFVTIQGETYGKGIQKREYGMKDIDFAAFNLIFGYKNGTIERLDTELMKDILETYDVPCVPILDNDFRLPETVEEMVEYAEGNSVIDGQYREGVVVRTRDGIQSFKAISNTYLLKKGE